MSNYSIAWQKIDYGIVDIGTSGIIRLTTNETYDILEDLLNELKTVRKNTVHAHAAGLDTDYTASTKMSQELDKLWNQLDNDDDDIYYLCGTDYNCVTNCHNNPIFRGNAILHLLCKGTYDTIEYETKLSPEKADVTEIRESHVAYLRLRDVSSDKHLTLSHSASLTASESTVDYINTNCRIFRCKACGRLTYVDRRKDRDMTDRGLKPVQRCYNCIQTRRRERNENDDLDERCINEMWAHF